ncbi:MAG: hypothetical protein HQK63_11520 [Desulfamplus sp.]|nr:hypothetical protein [Desulfamplus sp.]
MEIRTIRRFLPFIKDFKAFWKKQGTFKYALTSAEFPPVLLEPEEWIFSDNIASLLKELMRWEIRDMAIVEAPFNKKAKDTIKPESLIPWKIQNFPQEWELAVCDTFTPLGYLTEAINTAIKDIKTSNNLTSNILSDVSNSISYKQETCNESQDSNISQEIEYAFFQSLASNIDKIGYVLLKPEPPLSNDNVAYIDGYLKEWQEDEEL